ncbi:MAG: YggS family pyridoxal phosphate-dependent enzyme [Muribaculaceae bacterium]|nr:YggS family pyridoxal phosphate-dependent enzyme [Muribaculaceae bacterium]
MGYIADRIRYYKSTIPTDVELVAVSKFHPNESILEAYEAGQRAFGESRANELVAKATSLPDDIKWHFIGHLQTNKVRQILPYVSLIHSVDSERLLRMVDAESKRINRVTDVLLQLHVAQEETKFGFTPDELIQLSDMGIFNELQNVNIIGVMGMASNTDDTARIIEDFNSIKNAFDRLATGIMVGNESFKVISMGMSGDYLDAIECGSTMVRIGSDIFGERNY